MAAPIWVVTDGMAGNERQALALAGALAAARPELDGATGVPGAPWPDPPQVWRLRARPPWRPAAPRRLPGSERAFGETFRQALATPPRLAIGCGRLGALATRLLREAGARVVQILDPRLPARHWHALVVPEHDRIRAANVVTLIGSVHAIDAAWLAQARAAQPQLDDLPAPRTLLLLGGPIREVPLDAAWWQHTAQTLRAVHASEGGSVSICASRRTPAWLLAAVRREFGTEPRLPGVRWCDADDGDNPWAGLLARADRIVVSPDSVNMLSEAAATGADVRIASPELARGRHAAFLASLQRCGAARSLALAPLQPTTPLRELPRVAARVRELLA